MLKLRIRLIGKMAEMSLSLIVGLSLFIASSIENDKFLKLVRVVFKAQREFIDFIDGATGLPLEFEHSTGKIKTLRQ